MRFPLAWRLLTMGMLPLLLASCGGGGGGGGTTGAPTQTTESFQSVTLSGRVLDASNDGGVANATVTVTPVDRGRGPSRAPVSTTTTPEGSYSLHNVPPGKAQMSIALATGDYQSIELQIEVPSDRPTASVTARLVPRNAANPTSVTLTPKLQSLSAGTSQQFSAQVSGQPGLKAFFLVQGDAGSITADGLFAALKPGTATVIAQAGSVSDSTTITVTPALTTAGMITGTVTGPSGLPLDGATVSLDGGSTLTTGVDGLYTFAGVSPGTHTLTASKTGFSTAMQDVSVGSGQTRTLDWRLVDVQAASGTVIVE